MMQDGVVRECLNRSDADEGSEVQIERADFIAMTFEIIPELSEVLLAERFHPL